MRLIILTFVFLAIAHLQESNGKPRLNHHSRIGGFAPRKMFNGFFFRDDKKEEEEVCRTKNEESNKGYCQDESSKQSSSTTTSFTSSSSSTSEKSESSSSSGDLKPHTTYKSTSSSSNSEQTLNSSTKSDGVNPPKTTSNGSFEAVGTHSSSEYDSKTGRSVSYEEKTASEAVSKDGRAKGSGTLQRKEIFDDELSNSHREVSEDGVSDLVSDGETLKIGTVNTIRNSDGIERTTTDQARYAQDSETGDIFELEDVREHKIATEVDDLLGATIDKSVVEISPTENKSQKIENATEIDAEVTESKSETSESIENNESRSESQIQSSETNESHTETNEDTHSETWETSESSKTESHESYTIAEETTTTQQTSEEESHTESSEYTENDSAYYKEINT